jgi:predicted HD phosphohydrolase
VPAKRYLVATDPSYRDQLSVVSLCTLRAQGGAMSAQDVEDFRGRPGWEQAVELRLIDDRGKVMGLEVPGLEAYRDALARVVRAAAAPAP